MTATKREPLLVNKWYIPVVPDITAPRCPLAVSEKHVYYANGGDRHMECQIATFRRWARECGAQVQS
jgi:hypothetical protein